jgi:hypothetical protein
MQALASDVHKRTARRREKAGGGINRAQIAAQKSEFL